MNKPPLIEDWSVASCLHKQQTTTNETSWYIQEKILVFIDSYHSAFYLFQAAKILAESLHGELLVAYRLPVRKFFMTTRSQKSISKIYQYAKTIGATHVSLPSKSLADSLIHLIQHHSITQLVIGKSSRRMQWLSLWKEPIENSLLGSMTGVRIHLIPLPKPSKDKLPYQLKWFGSIHPIPLVFHIFLVIALTVFCLYIAKDIGLINISMLFIIPLLLSSVWGYQNSIIISIISFLFYDYFFIPPYHTLFMHDPWYWFSLVIFLFIAFLSGYLSYLLQSKAELALNNQTQINSLFSLSKDIAIDTSLDVILKKIMFEISEYTNTKVIMLFPDEKGNITKKFPDEMLTPNEMDYAEIDIANWTFQNKQEAGKGTNIYQTSNHLFFPITAYNKIFGVICIDSHEISINKDPILRRYLEAIARLTAIAIHRLELNDKANENKLIAESQRLQKALFDSISHDLNTPLTTILGSVGSLLDEGDLYSQKDKNELLASIQQGAFDMNRLVRNLLDMAQLDSRILTLQKEYADIADIIENSLQKCKQSDKWNITRLIDQSIPPIQIDAALIEQVMINLLDNAFKYSKEGSEISIKTYSKDNNLYVEVDDQGIGIHHEDMEHIFSKFYRSKKVKSIGGTGLGLSICKGIIEAHGGTISALSKPEGGSSFIFSLPYKGSSSNGIN